MRYAVFSDVHGNLEALRAVLADAASRSDVVLCLGDVVGYGADPAACVDLVGERCQAVVGGNHEHAVTGRLDLEWFNPYARAAAEWTRGELSRDAMAWLTRLPLISEVDEATIVHASPAGPDEWDYLVSAQDGFAAFGAFETRLCFVGHSHVSRFDPLYRYIVNVGSVGQPRDGDPRAAYALWDSERRSITVRRVLYDVGAARAKIVAAGLPRFLADRLGEGR